MKLNGMVSNELQEWFAGLMLIEHIAGLLKQKIEQGHCQLHRKSSGLNPCLEMPQEHMKMLYVVKASVLELANEIETMIKNVKVPQ